MKKISVKGMTPVQELLLNSHDKDTLHRFAQMAESFLISHSWCKLVKNSYLGYGIDGILGVFFCEIVPTKPEIDHYLWVIVGDIPPAYLVCDDAFTPSAALDKYVYEMSRWVIAAKGGESTDEIIPICYQDSMREIPPTIEYAEMLESRLSFIEQELIPDAKLQESQS